MRDDFDEKTKETLAKRAGMRCSNPDCGKLTSGPRDDPTKALNIGVAAHITAAAVNGPRFNPGLSSAERKSILNALWLCQNCAKLVDNDPVRFTVAMLNDWKRLAEESALLSIQGASSSSASSVSDADLVRFYAQCLDRPAFQDEFRREGSMEAFDKAIEDTITAINTGCSRLRDGQLVMQTRGKVYLKNMALRQRMDVIVDLLRWIRSRYAEAVADGSIALRSGPTDRIYYLVNEPGLTEWMDNTRIQILGLFAEVCRELGVAPPPIRLTPNPRSVGSIGRSVPGPSEQSNGERLVLGRMLHELGSPIAAIRSAGELIKSSRDESELQSLADDVEGFSVVMGMLVSNFRYLYTPPDLGAAARSRTLLNRDVLDPVLKALELALKERGASPSQIHATGFSNLPPLWLDQEGIRLAVHNLLSNAIKYTIQGNAVSVLIAASRVASGFEIRVCDWGVGVDQEEERHIFEMGWRSARVEAHDVRGVGAGLTVARRVAEAHGGALQLARGRQPTEFVLHLPDSVSHKPR